MALARAAAVIVSLAQTCIWWRPYHSTLGVIQTISREHGVLYSEQVCVHSHVFPMRARDHHMLVCTCPFCVWLYCLYHRYRPLLQVDRVEIVQRTWLPKASRVPHLLLWLHDPLLNQLKQSNTRSGRDGGRGDQAPCTLVQHALQWHSNLEPMGIGLKCVELFGYILF